MKRRMKAIDALRLAVERERGALNFYRDAARMDENPDGRRMFHWLAKEEARHLIRLRGQLNALLAVCDKEQSLLIAGTGEIIEPEDGILAIGSGGSYALAAARSLAKHTDMGAEEIVREALSVAAEICIYTNNNITVETLEST